MLWCLLLLVSIGLSLSKLGAAAGWMQQFVAISGDQRALPNVGNGVGSSHSQNF
jgi:hypothetical protein